MLDPKAPAGWTTNYSDSHEDASVTVRISVDSAARVTATKIQKSSGDFALDQQARKLANDAKLIPSASLCATAPGDYAFVVDFAN